MTPAILILFGLFLTLTSAAAICVLILVERRRTKHRAHLAELFEPMAHTWRNSK